MSTCKISRYWFFLLVLVLFSGRTFAQWESLGDGKYINVDTSDYLPYLYDVSLDFNLMIAAAKGYPSEVERLIKKGADINAKTDLGVTPLILAVVSDKPETVATLLAYKPEIDNFTKYNENALLLAVKNQNSKITEMLIRAGANINIGDRFDATPLHYASIYGFAEIADLLIYYDADLNSKTSDGSTPLHGTVWAGNIMITDILVQNGARIEERDNEGFTPFLLAAYFGDTLMMELFSRNGADMFARTNKGYSALTLSIISENKASAGYLLKLEKNWAGEEKSLSDPYALAAKYQRKDIVELLKLNNIPGKIRYEIDQIDFSLSSRFLGNDYYSGFALTFKEPYLNAGFITGIDTKLWYTKVLRKETDAAFYQFWEKGSLAYAGLFKDYVLSRNPNKSTTEFSASLLAGYSFGNDLKGTIYSPLKKFKIIPSATFRLTYQKIMVTAGLEYIRTDYYDNGPVWVRIGIGYNYYLDNLRGRIKYPKWY